MCWSKRSSPDFSTVTTTTFTPTVSRAINDTSSELCQYPAVECFEDEYCSFHGQCCALDGIPSYCACSDDYTGKFCETEKLDPMVLESLEAGTTIGIAVGVSLFFIAVLVAVVVLVVMIHRKKNINILCLNRRQSRTETVEQAENSTTQVDHNSNGRNGTSCEESETMLPDCNDNNRKPTSK